MSHIAFTALRFDPGGNYSGGPNMEPQERQLTSQLLASRHSLFAFIHGIVRSTHDAEDIFQEVYLRFADAVRRGVEIQDPARWCRGTARNLILHHWRSQRNAKVVMDSELFDLIELAFGEQDDGTDYWLTRQQALSDCVGELPPHSRDLLRLKYDEDLTADGVAGRLSRSAASVLMALSRLRRSLRECAEKKLRLEGMQP